MTEQQAVRDAFAPFNQEHRVRESKIGCVVSLILVPAGFLLDLIVYPEMVWQFLLLRFLCDAVILVILGLHFTQFGRENIRALMFGWSLTIQLTLCLMIYFCEGANSTYYAGLNLVVLAIGLVLPFNFKEAVTFCCISLAMYWLTCYLHVSDQGIDQIILFNNSYFIILTAIISIVSLYFKEERRFESFRLNYNLEEQNRKLEEMDEYKTQFFANISHELRTPLTLILGPLEDILRSAGSLDERVATLMYTARDNGLRLLKLVNDLLDLIKLEAGKQKLSLQPVELNQFTNVLIDSVQHLADTRGIIIKNELSGEPLVVKSDEGSLERILMNLFSNALKFTDQEGTITIRSEQIGDEALISIKDTGIGISQHDLPFIFDRFRQADGSTTRKFTGTGIGLALVKELIENMSGRIEVDSEPGVGTEMKMYLQLSGPEEVVLPSRQGSIDEDSLLVVEQSVDAVAVMPINEPEGIFNPTDINANLPKVLVVDDEPDMRRYLVDMLSENYVVLEARDGQQGLELARKHVPEMMVLDLMLPEIDGHEVCRVLKSEDVTSSIKIVMLTATVDDQAKIKALDYGANDFLNKPFGRVELLTRLNNLHRSARLEQDLIKNNTSLTSTLKELKTVQANLIQSEKINAIGNLSAGLLHEINNPLNYSLAAIQMLMMESSIVEDPDSREMVEDINDGMERIKAIVGDLRAFAYPSEAEKQSTFSFESALNSAIRFTSAELKSVEVIRDIAKPDQVHGSHSHIVQVLVNLLTNAAKAIKSGQDSMNGEIQIFTQSDGNRYIVNVRDNGIGMDQQTQKQIFDPFFTTGEVGQGMGMGLSICHTIISNHEGSLSVQSEPGEGSTFTFDIITGNTSKE